MNTYKVIISDIDGTLIPNASKAPPSAKVKRAIKSVQKKGILANARSFPGAAPIVEALELSSYASLITAQPYTTYKPNNQSGEAISTQQIVTTS